MQRKNLYVVSIVIFLLAAACSAGINLFSDKDDAEMGKKFSEEILNHPKEYPIYQNTAVKNYINNRIFNEILKSPEIKKKNVYNYQLEVIDNDTTLNAFAVPGGYIYLYTGLLKYLDSEAALAGVIGHEIGHVEKRHSTQRITKAYGLSLLMNIVLGSNPNDVAAIVGNLFSGLALLANSRSDEEEADAASLAYMRSTRYYPGSVKFFFEKLKAEGKIEKGDQGLATFLSTHPDPIERISTTDQRLRTLGIEVRSFDSDGNGIYRSGYQKNIRAKIK
ncbi:M48 family metalloprotease [Bacteroidota bacterium]